MTYSPRKPPRGAILDAWLRAHPFQLSSTPEDRKAEFEMWESSIKAQALEEAASLMEDIARSETMTRRFTEHVLVEAGAPNVLREYAQRYRNLA